jgi:hypothetical protein
MAQVIMAALDQWLANLPPTLVQHLPTGLDESNQLLHKLINDDFDKQTDIGWGHFLRGCLLLHWKMCIAEYYKVRQPGDTYNSRAPMAQVIMAALDQWLANLPPTLVKHLPTGLDESNQLLHKLINDAFDKQMDIGWGHFLRGCLLLHWKMCIAEYYKVRQPGDTYKFDIMDDKDSRCNMGLLPHNMDCMKW